MKKLFTFFMCCLSFSFAFGQDGHADLLSGKARELLDKGTKCWNSGGSDCIIYFQEAYQLVKKARQNNEPSVEVEIAKSYSYLQKYDSATFYLDLAQHGLKKMDYSDIRVKHLDSEIQNSYAMNFYFQGKIDSAIVYLKKNIEVIDKTGNKKSSAFAKINLASIYLTVQDYRSAINTNLQALKELHDLKVTQDARTAIVAGNLAVSYNGINDEKAAVFWAKKAISLGKANNSIAAQFHGNYIIGLSISKTQPDSALKYIDEALSLAKSSGRPAYISKAMMVKGIAMGEVKNYAEAIKNLSEAKKLLEENPGDMDYIETIRNLGLYASEAGDYKLSSLNLRAYVLAMDSVHVEKNQTLIHEYQAKYETEKKEKQISEQALKIQRQQNSLLFILFGGSLIAITLTLLFINHKRTERLKLKQLQQEKENEILNSFILGEELERKRISYELHDGIAAMIGAAKMSLDAIPHLSQEKRLDQLVKVQGILERTHADVRHIAHNLLPTVLENEGLIKAVFHFADEINEMNQINISVLNKTQNNIAFTPQIQLILFRVIQELVSNILKHAKAKKAEIEFSTTSDKLVILVVDYGIGYKINQHPKNQGLFSITERLKSIGGFFELNELYEGGTIARIELSL